MLGGCCWLFNRVVTSGSGEVVRLLQVVLVESRWSILSLSPSLSRVGGFELMLLLVVIGRSSSMMRVGGRLSSTGGIEGGLSSCSKGLLTCTVELLHDFVGEQRTSMLFLALLQRA